MTNYGIACYLKMLRELIIFADSMRIITTTIIPSTPTQHQLSLKVTLYSMLMR